MKISNLRIENYRSFKDQTIDLVEYTCIVRANGAGKSTVLSALNVFFQNVTSGTPNVKELDEEDFHLRHTGSPIRITVTFSELSDTEKVDLADYVHQDQLVVVAEASWDQERRVAVVKQ
jgi:AAA15 family ATPase/GTPase